MAFVVMVSICLVGLVMYRLGKLHGEKSGYDEARTRTPVELRAQSLQTGICPICDQCQSHATIYQKG